MSSPGVSAGWLSAAYNPDTSKIGICWYDLKSKTLKFVEKEISATSWGTPEQVDTSGDDTGSNCSLAYGPGTGVLPGPGISYYDTTARQLRFAWKETTGWEHVTVDSNGSGTSSSLAYGKNGYPHIAYRSEDQNALKYAYLKPGTGIEAGFTSDVTAGAVPLTVHFSDTTLNDTISSLQDDGDPDLDVEVHYWWDLDGDEEWEAEDIPNPTHTYETPGSYDVKMLIHVVITNYFDGTSNLVDLWGISDINDYITANSSVPVTAGFNASPVSGTPPLEVTFTDTSGGTPDSWNWTFGDGTGSHDQNPVHTYAGIGRYTVTLEVNGPQGSDIIRRPVYIDVNSRRLTGQTGMLRINTVPSGADIYVDTVFRGVTPTNELIARVGERNVLVHLDGYQNWTGTVQVPPGTVKIIPTIRLRQE